MKNLLISLLLTVTFTCAAYASDLGDFGNFFDKVWDEMKDAYSSTDGGEYIDEMGRHHYNAPGYSYRVPTSTIQPFSARGPSIKAGCSGISVDLGAFDFLEDEDRLVEFLKDVVKGVPGYSFNLAMQTFCPQCTELLNKLNSLANMINGIQMDSCGVLDAAATAGAGMLREQFANKTQTGDDDASSFTKFMNSANDGLGSFVKQAEDFINKFACATGSGTDCPVRWMDPSYVKAHNATMLSTMLYRSASLKAMDLVNEDQDDLLETVIRAFIGDIVYSEGKSNSDGETQPIIKYIAPIYPADEVKEALNIWIGGKADDNATDNTKKLRLLFRNGIEGTVDVEANYQLTNIAIGFLAQIQDSYDKRDKIPADALAFLQTFKAPVYKILNNASVEPMLLTQYILIFAELSGKQFAYEVFLSLSKEVRTMVNDSENTIIAGKTLSKDEALRDNILRINANLNNLTRYSYEAYVEAYATFNEGLAKLNELQSFQYRMQAQMARHPIYGSYLLGKGLTVGH
jgi:hypothetical protein